MQVKCKIKDYTLSLRQRDCIIVVQKNGKEVKQIRTKLFKGRGMIMFPKELYKLIITDITSARIYDKFLDKYYTWDEEDCEC